MDKLNEKDVFVLSNEKEEFILTDKKRLIKEGHKRQNEIQALRGIAILSVLLFHLWPNEFETGYLGVDTFLVVSGYLISTILSKNQPLNFQPALNFYFRRLKRILPLYLSTVFVVFVGAYFFVGPSDFMLLYREVMKPLLFVANRPSSLREDYFAQV